MSLVSAAGGKNRAAQTVSELQFQAGKIAEEITRLSEISIKIGDIMSRQQNQYMTGQMSIFRNQAQGTNQTAPSWQELFELLNGQSNVNTMERKQELLHHKEKILVKKKNIIETKIKTAEADYEREKKFEDKSIKISYKYT